MTAARTTAVRAAGRAARAGGVLLAAGAAAVLVAPARFAPGTTGVAGRVDAAGADAGAAAGPTAVAPAAAPTGTTDGDPAPADRVGTPPGAATSADLRLVELRGGWRDREDLATAVALAVLVGTAHADTTLGAGARVAVEAVEQPGPDAAVVTLLVAPARAEDADAPRAVRLAVPVRTGAGGVRVAGNPWTLPGPRLDPDPPAGDAVTDADLLEAAADALARAGIGADLASLETTDAWPFVARLDGGPGGSGSTTVWLRWHLDRFVVSGLPLQTAAGSGEGTGFP